MSITTQAGLFGVALVTFLGVDMLWLGFIAQRVYHEQMGHLLLDSPRWPVAIAFYALFIVGLMYFAIVPAVDAGELRTAVVRGALYGLFTYATYDLTNYAVLKGYPGFIVPVDMAWGTFLAALVATTTFVVHRTVSQ